MQSVVMVFLLWFLDHRSLLHQHSLPRKWNHWWREKLGEEETCYNIPSSDCRVFDRLCTLCGFPHCCCISDIDISLYSHLQNAFRFMFSCSLCLNPLVYAFRSAHFREGFKRFLTTCWKPTPQDDDVHWFRYFFLFSPVSLTPIVEYGHQQFRSVD